ncbi:MAG: SusC/RagA family TonB-linked outer membrane protein, partial [Saprospiraceae bacterium]
MHQRLLTCLVVGLLCLLLPAPVSSLAAQSGLRADASGILPAEDLQSDRISLETALQRIGRVHDISFSYRIDLIRDILVEAPNLAREADPVRLVQAALRNTGIEFRQLTRRRIVIFQPSPPTDDPAIGKPGEQPGRQTGGIEKKTEVAPTSPPAPEIILVTVSGRVTDNLGEPLIGATLVLESDGRLGTNTDIDGRYALELPAAEGTLVVSYVSYQTRKIAIGGRTDLDIVLESESMGLEQIIVTGYGSQRRSDIIGSVSSVRGDDLMVKSTANFDQALQGMAAGVSILSQSGKPGAPSTIRIRGANSIQSSTEPLWVIDGMPVYSSPGGLGSSNQNPMSMINPNDIESIQILKDAAATSIYGSRGSNGVILVTTKTGVPGEGNTTLSVATGISDLTRNPDDVGYVNTQEYFQVMDQAYQNTFGRDFRLRDYYQFSPLAFDSISREDVATNNIDTDWYDEVFRMGSFHDFNLSSSRGTEKGSYYLSANYRSDRGVLTNNQLDRFSVRSNLRFEPLNNVTIDARLNFSFTNNERRNEDMTTLIKFSLPWFPVRQLDNPNVYFNPYAAGNLAASNDAVNTLNNVKQYRGLGVVSLQYALPFVPGLKLRTEVAADFIQSNLVDWSSRSIRLDGGKNPSAFAREEAVTYRSLNYNAYGNYDRTFGRHNVGGVLGIEAQRINQYDRILAGEGLTGDYQELGNPGTPLILDGRQTGERYLLGYFGRLNYKFNDRYLLGVSARRDGSSVFSVANRWGNFVAFSAGWILSEERALDFLGNGLFLKLRGSYGETGNQSIPNNLQAVNYFDRVVFGNRQVGSNGTIPSNLAVGNLLWESTRSTDLGIDYGFLDNRINGTIAYYRRFVEGMLLEAQLPSSAGVSPSRVDADFGFLNTVEGPATNKIWSNVGNMVNSGIEFEIYTVNVDRPDFSWSTGFNISFNRNEIKGLTPELNASGQGITSAYTISRTGGRRNVWYVAEYAGVNPENGVPYVYALDEDYFEESGQTRRLQNMAGTDSLLLGTRANVRENRFIQEGKSSDPTYYGGITNKLTFKNFDLSFLIAFSGGNYLLDYDRQVAVYPNETRTLLREALTDSWQEPGDEARYPALVARQTFEVADGQFVGGFGDEDVFHDRELYRADFVRLRNVNFGYSLPQNVLDKLRLQGLRISVTGTNLWTRTDYPGFDPEGTPNVGTNAQILYNNTPIPQLKSLLIGLDAQF